MCKTEVVKCVTEVVKCKTEVIVVKCVTEVVKCKTEVIEHKTGTSLAWTRVSTEAGASQVKETIEIIPGAMPSIAWIIPCDDTRNHGACVEHEKRKPAKNGITRQSHPCLSLVDFAPTRNSFDGKIGWIMLT